MPTGRYRLVWVWPIRGQMENDVFRELAGAQIFAQRLRMGRAMHGLPPILTLWIEASTDPNRRFPEVANVA